jgi:maltose alpha-D-glucosyltransferase/alpha-amylase
MEPIPQKAESDLWWKAAVFYCLDVETFMDANGDGVGDFLGLTSRVPYLAQLGVTCLWLLPFHPSPNRDDGYDISDYYGIDPRLGTLGDFVEFVRTAHANGLRVMMDLVVNHTSDQHPWFKHSRSDPESPYRDWYVWSKTKPAKEPGIVFPGEQTSTWTYDQKARAWYLHRFHDFQPDLNIANPDVRDEIRKITGFWLHLGVSGFRIDAAPFVIDETGIADPAAPDPHAYLRSMRAFVDRRRGDAALLGEVDLEPDQQAAFFGKDDTGDELHALFNFLLNNALVLSLAAGDGRPLEEALKQLPAIPWPCQWVTFLRVHDELNLHRLSDEEKALVARELAPDDDMWVYGRGIRRRTAPMLGGDRRRLELAYSLVLSLPGSPLLLYGDEIGIGDDLKLPARLSVRIPMQWTAEENAGFSSAARRRLVRPVVRRGPYAYAHVNAAAQLEDPDSLLSWMRRAIWARRQCPELGWGEWKLLETEPHGVFAHTCTWFDATVLVVHNLSSTACEVDLDPRGEQEGRVVSAIFGDDLDAVSAPADLRFVLQPYGYRWLRVRDAGDVVHFP